MANWPSSKLNVLHHHIWNKADQAGRGKLFALVKRWKIMGYIVKIWAKLEIGLK